MRPFARPVTIEALRFTIFDHVDEGAKISRCRLTSAAFMLLGVSWPADEEELSNG